LVLQEHLSRDGLMERIHGNTKNVPHNKSRAIVDIVTKRCPGIDVISRE